MSLADLPGIASAFLEARRAFAIRDRNALLARQERLLARLRTRTLAASPFYRPYAATPFDRLPVIGKARWMAEFDAINTAGIRREEAMALAQRAEAERDFSATIGGVTVGLSTGTSGRRGLFLVSPAERRRWAGVMLAALLPGNPLRRRKIAFLLRANSNLYETAGAGPLDFSYFDMLQPWPELTARLRSFAPEVLIAPASALDLLAREGGLKPRQVISVAETLHDDEAARIEEAFGVKPEQVYQATEGVIALPCKFGKLHLNEAFLRIETDWIDRAGGRFAPVVTDLTRHTQPVVRYRLDDIVTLDEAPCACGSASRVVSRIEGRCDEVCRFLKADGGTAPVFPDLLVRTVLATIPAVSDFTITQRRDGELAIRLGAGEDIPPALTLGIEALAQMLGALPPAISRDAAPQAPGKRRRVVRMVGPEGLEPPTKRL